MMNTTGEDRKKKNAIIIGVVIALQVVTFVGMPHLFGWAKKNLPARAEVDHGSRLENFGAAAKVFLVVGFGLALIVSIGYLLGIGWIAAGIK